MRASLIRSIVISCLMASAAALAYTAKPNVKIADLGPKVNLETMIPSAFGDWKIDTTVVPLLPDPAAQALINKIYNQTLARTYINAHGDRIMLSVAYGGDQSDSMRVHRPEVCYAAQGFQILRQSLGDLPTKYGSLPVKRLLAQLGGRLEPITYWVTVGEKATYSDVRQKLVQLSFGLRGQIPDGMLIRVSSIDRDESRAYGQQKAFITEMLDSMKAEDRARLGGAGGAS